MTARSTIIDRHLAPVKSGQDVRRSLLIACVYVALSVALDRISLVQVLPESGFTLWNPVAPCSLALLLVEGLWFAPALFVGGALADGINGGFYSGVISTLVVNTLVAAGYTAIAAMLRRLGLPTRGFKTLSDTCWFLGIVAVGILALAVAVAVALALVRAVAPNQIWASARHFWVGDFTGVIGLLPMLITVPRAWERWRELPASARLVDPAIFAITLGVALWIVVAAGQSQEFEFFYLFLLPVIWIGARHGLPWCTVAILIEQLAIIGVITLLDYPRWDFIAFQLLSLAIALTGLVLGAVVTERQHAELCLREQHAGLARMARITTAGALGSAIIHEVSQPLATVATYAHACCQLLISSPRVSAQVMETVAKIEAEALRAGKIVERLRDFLSKGRQELSRVSLDQVVNRVVAMLADEARLRGVSISVTGEPSVSLEADRVQIEQVLVNLTRNGIEAAAENGRRTKHVLIHLHQSNGAAQIDVEDNGPGVPPDIADRLFEPFITSKPRGMGLGLLLSRQIIECHGGTLWCDRLDRGGMRFAFRIPRQGPHTNAR